MRSQMVRESRVQGSRQKRPPCCAVSLSRPYPVTLSHGDGHGHCKLFPGMSFGIAPGEGGFFLFVVKSALAGRCNFGNDPIASRLMVLSLKSALSQCSP